MGEFLPGSVGELPPSMIYVVGNSSTLEIYFLLCVTVFLLKLSDVYRFINFS